MERKKPTNKEIVAKVEMLTNVNNIAIEMIENIGNSLKQYIEFIGMPEAANLFGCSEASIKAWRYGYRQPSINQAKKIIQSSDGKLDFESIYGNLDSSPSDSVQSQPNR